MLNVFRHFLLTINSIYYTTVIRQWYSKIKRARKGKPGRGHDLAHEAEGKVTCNAQQWEGFGTT